MTASHQVTFIGPKENFPLSEPDYELCLELMRTVSGLRERREDYIHDKNLQREVFIPGHIWSGEFCPQNFTTLTGGAYHTVNHLRMLTYNFTGFRLIDMEDARGKELVTEIPPEIDSKVRENAEKGLQFVPAFVNSVRGLNHELIIKPPRIFGESGFEFKGIIINRDTWSTQLRINALFCSGVMDYLKRIVRKRGSCRIMEIGAGYGDLAYALTRILGDVDYFIVDLPESLVFSSCYLNVTRPNYRHEVLEADVTPAKGSPSITYLSNYLLDDFLTKIDEVDMVVNVLSLSEMAPVQVEYYGQTIKKFIGRTGLFFEQNYYEPNFHTNIEPILSKHFPYHRKLSETTVPHVGRGNARIWTNNYLSDVYDVTDVMLHRN